MPIHLQRTIAIIVLSVIPTLAVTAGDYSVKLDPAETRIEWSLAATAHIVTGRFDLLQGQISWNGESREASGIVEIDATSAVTGNRRRDETMHRDVLESGRYSRFVFRPTRVEGDPLAAESTRIVLRGILTIRGRERPLEIPASVVRKGIVLQVDGVFRIPYVDWGMKDPSIFLLRVAKEVEVRISTSTRLNESH